MNFLGDNAGSPKHVVLLRCAVRAFAMQAKRQIPSQSAMDEEGGEAE